MWIASFGIALKHLKRRPPLPKKTDTRLSFDQKRHKRFYFLKPNFTAFLMAGTLFLLLGACQQKASYEIIFVQKDETSFTATALDYRLEFTSDGIAVKSKPDIEQGSEWLIYFDGAEPEQSVLHQNEDKSAALVYQNLYPETNLHFYDKGNGRAAYDFILAPGAKVSDICLNLEGPKPPFINQYGELVLPLAEGEIRHSAPYSYQEIDGQKKIVESRFVLEDNCLSFEVGAYDQNYPLTIDPTISFAPPMPPDVFAELVGEFSSTSAEIGGEVMTLKITYGVNSNESDLSGGRIEVPLPYGLLAGGIALTSHFSGSTINPGSPSGPGSIILNFHDPVASGIAGAVYIDISFDRGTVCPGDIFPVDATLFFEGNAEASIEEFNLTALDVDQDWVLSSNFSITETCGTSCPSG